MVFKRRSHCVSPVEGGYDEKTVKRYREECGREPQPNPRERHWLHWRADIITEFVARLYREVKAINPDLLLSMSPSPYEWGLVEYLQDSKAWVDKNLVDLLHPQFYRRDFNAYKQLVDKMMSGQLSWQQVKCVSPGILLTNRGSKYSNSRTVVASNCLQPLLWHSRRSDVFLRRFARSITLWLRF